MKTKRLKPSERRRSSAVSDWSPQEVGLEPELYRAALRYLFDRPVPKVGEKEWFWNIDEPDFEATPLQWTRIQTVLFANAGTDLEPFSDDQVGLGLNYVMSNSCSDLPFMAIDPTVPLEEAMRMMRAMPMLWRDCIGPRLAHAQRPIGLGCDPLGFVCYMWFDVWPTFWNVRDQRPWQDAMWNVLSRMLVVPCREVQIAALHGIGHDFDRTYEPLTVDRAIDEFVKNHASGDAELATYAEAARRRCVL